MAQYCFNLEINQRQGTVRCNEIFNRFEKLRVYRTRGNGCNLTLLLGYTSAVPIKEYNSFANKRVGRRNVQRARWLCIRLKAEVSPGTQTLFQIRFDSIASLLRHSPKLITLSSILPQKSCCISLQSLHFRDSIIAWLISCDYSICMRQYNQSANIFVSTNE